MQSTKKTVGSSTVFALCSFVLHIFFAAGLCTLSGAVCCELLLRGRRGGEHCAQGMTSYLCGGRREVGGGSLLCQSSFPTNGAASGASVAGW